jgi:DNA-binding transcriptional regulator YiaG
MGIPTAFPHFSNFSIPTASLAGSRFGARRLSWRIFGASRGGPKRIVDPVVIDGLPEEAPELVLSRLLDEYRTAREERFKSTSRRAQAAAGLLVVGLQQRLLSSIEAFARSLKVHRATVERQWERGQTVVAETVNLNEKLRYTNSSNGTKDRALHSSAITSSFRSRFRHVPSHSCRIKRGIRLSQLRPSRSLAFGTKKGPSCSCHKKS